MIIKKLNMNLHEKLFERAFPNDKPVTSKKEIFKEFRFFGKEINKVMVSDFEKAGWIESENRGERIYNKKGNGFLNR